MGRRRLTGSASLLLMLAACGGEDVIPSDEEPDPPAPEGCVPGERPLDDGSCRPAGIIETSCGEGFAYDPLEGCLAVMPEAVCPAGTMAVPGDVECHPVAPCPAGRWGDLPSDRPIVYVDTAATGTPDGSEAAPYADLLEAFLAAPNGSALALAAGSYTGGIGVDKPLHILGKCAAETAIVGTIDYPAALAIVQPVSNGNRLADVALTGPGVGLAVDGATGVVVERVWIHDTGSTGLHVQASSTPTEAVLRNSLIESVVGTGIYDNAGTLRIEASAVRGVAFDGPFAVGLIVQSDAAARGNVTLTDSVVEQTPLIGVSFQGADGLVERSLVRGIASTHAQSAALAIADQPNVAGSVVTVRQTVVEDVSPRGIGIVGSEAVLEDVVVRDVLPNASDGSGGRGIAMENSLVDGRRSAATIRGSAILRSHEVGILVGAADAIVESTVVEGTTFNGLGLGGRAVGVQGDPGFGNAASAVLRWSRFSRNAQTSVFISGQVAVIEDTLVEETLLSNDGLWGRGVEVREDVATATPGYLELRRSTIDNSIDQGLLVLGAEAFVEDLTVSRSQSNPNDGLFGDGIAVVLGVESGTPVPATAWLARVDIVDSGRAGIANFGATVATNTVTVRCGAIDLAAEPYQGVSPSFEDQGNTLCGCDGELSTCKAVSASLAPPSPLDPL